MHRLPPTEGLPKDIIVVTVLCALVVNLILLASGFSWEPIGEFLSAGGSIECDLSTGTLLGSSKQR
jgi:hypothetical protein